MAKKDKKEKNALINHKNLERNVLNEIANEFQKSKSKQQ
jgi:hypothetical protein